MASAQAAPRRRARAPQETTAATDAHVQVIALALVSKSGIKCACKRRHATPKFFLFTIKGRAPRGSCPSFMLNQFAVALIRGFNKHAGPDPKRLHQKTLAYQRSAAHGYHGPHNDDLNPLCLSGTAASHAPLCACMWGYAFCVVRLPGRRHMYVLPRLGRLKYPPPHIQVCSQAQSAACREHTESHASRPQYLPPPPSCLTLARVNKPSRAPFMSARPP